MRQPEHLDSINRRRHGGILSSGFEGIVCLVRQKSFLLLLLILILIVLLIFI